MLARLFLCVLVLSACTTKFKAEDDVISDDWEDSEDSLDIIDVLDDHDTLDTLDTHDTEELDQEISPLCGNGTVDSGEECDDGNHIPGDGCELNCTYTCTQNSDCDDGQVCNGEESCNTSDPLTHPCMAGLNAEPGTACDDTLFCDGTEQCDGSGGCSVHSGNPCTGGSECNRICNETSDNCFDPTGTPCESSLDDDCTDPDACDGAGTCMSNNAISGTSCTDELYCTDSETCDGNGICEGAPVSYLYDISDIAAGGYACVGDHTCALASTGWVMCWGSNFWGQLGDGTTTDHFTPVDVVGLSSGVSSITAGAGHTCALLTTGGMKCWGYNYAGQLGNGTTTDSYAPVDVSGLSSGVSAISAGMHHTCALLSTGGVKCWGNNDYSQLGDETTTRRLVPVDVSGLSSGVLSITAGDMHTCVVMVGGGVKCWGNNGSYQLGDGTTTTRTTPVEVSGLSSGVSAVALDYSFTCALLLSGGMKCWGENMYGQLGDGTTTQRMTAVDVIGLSAGVSDIALGRSHTCALLTSGGVQCWGYNAEGEIGDGTTTQRNSPVNVSGLSNGVSAIASADKHTCTVLSTGEVLCWGFNHLGQLGDGTTDGHVNPVNVVCN
jgi:cysteine-rich repeat protein